MSPGECLRRLERAARPRQKTQEKFLHIRAIRVYSWFLSFSFHCAAGGSGTYQRHLAAHGVSALSAGCGVASTRGYPMYSRFTEIAPEARG